MSNENLKNDFSISLDWTDVASATKYWILISKNYLDFRSTLESEDNNVASSAYTFTASGNGTFYYRWRPYIVSWQPWREVSSFIVNTSLSADFSATAWTLVSKSDVTDYYILELSPMTAEIKPAHLWESFTRNRAGDIISEQYKTKEDIVLDISRTYLGDNQKAELMRFYNSHTSFYLVARYDNQTLSDYVYRSWEVMFLDIPQLDIIGGNILSFTEV